MCKLNVLFQLDGIIKDLIAAIMSALQLVKMLLVQMSVHASHRVEMQRATITLEHHLTFVAMQCTMGTQQVFVSETLRADVTCENSFSSLWSTSLE